MNRAGNEKLDNKTMVLPVAAGERITEANMVALNGEGYAITGKAAEDLIAAGVAMSPSDNTGGESGAVTVVVRRGAFVFDNTSTAASAVKVTDVLKNCYMESGQVVTMSSTGTSVAGKILAVDDDGITVEIL